MPATYQLGKIAQQVAEKMKLPLHTEEKFLYDCIYSFTNVPIHLVCAIQSEINDEIVLMGERSDEALLYYRGGISSKTQKPLECLYLNNLEKVIGVTWGYPEDCGVLEILDVKSSIALQELSEVSAGMGGRAVCVYHMEAPKPQPLKGTAQFSDFLRLYQTIEALLK